MTDDRTLLLRYASTGDEAAFAEVVRRHLDFVYTAALRRLGRDTHRAQDVTQIVFCALARDAGRIAREPVLGGWLYVATRNAAFNVIRSEKRRRTREEEAAHMQQIERESEAPADWARLRPVVDAAMDRLQARDREAILLRFFQGRSLGEVGAAVGLSEDAARKRIDRALTRLRDLLRPHGVASTAGALAAVLANQPLVAAPTGMLAGVTGVALSAGSVASAGVGMTTFITMTKLQVGIATAVFVAGAVALLVQQRTISTLKENAVHTQAQLARLSGYPASPLGKSRDGAGGSLAQASGAGTGTTEDTTRVPAIPGELLVDATVALQHGKVPERYFAFVSALRKLSPENWREVLQAFQDERKRTGLGHPEVYEIFIRRAGEVAGKDVVTYMLKQGWTGDASEAMIGWAAKNPAEALQWLGRDADMAARRGLMASAIRGLALAEPDLAVKTLEEQPVQDRKRYTTEFVTSMLRSAGLDGAQHLVEGMISRAEAGGLEKEDYLKHVVHDYSLLRMAQAAPNGTLSESLAWLDQYVGQPYLDHQVIATAGARLAQENPQEAFRWLEGVNTTLLRAGATDTVGYRAALDTWRSKEGAPVVEKWLQGQTSHPHYDQIASQYVALVAPQDPDQALRWANTIKDTTVKTAALKEIDRRRQPGKS